MKAAVLKKNGNPTTTDVLAVVDAMEIPTPIKGEILVKVKSASMNPIDYKLMQGDFPGLKEGLVGYDVSGVVASIGPDTVTTLKVGDAVYADSASTKGGSFAEFVRVQAVAASLKPKNIDFREAAALPLAGLTALQGLVTHGGLKHGGRVAILGASGGVGSLAVQMAKYSLGASHVFATGSSVDFIKGLGADTVINYREVNVEEALAGNELDVVFDTVGGYDGWLAAQGGLKKGGVFVTVVGDGTSIPKMIPGILWRKLMSLFGGPTYDLYLTDTTAPAVVADMATITKMVESKEVKPVLDDRVFELTTESVHEMIKASMSHRTKGKLVLTVTK
jgi:NADPH:quinone reductase-like Zn-dependent oxidoreductase